MTNSNMSVGALVSLVSSPSLVPCSFNNLKRIQQDMFACGLKGVHFCSKMKSPSTDQEARNLANNVPLQPTTAPGILGAHILGDHNDFHKQDRFIIACIKSFKVDEKCLHSVHGHYCIIPSSAHFTRLCKDVGMNSMYIEEVLTPQTPRYFFMDIERPVHDEKHLEEIRLYFDSYFLDLLTLLVGGCLALSLTREDWRITEASNASKFSRHLVLLTPQRHYFKDCKETELIANCIKINMAEILGVHSAAQPPLEYETASLRALSNFYLYVDSSKTKTIIDFAVYKGTRNMRMVGSLKVKATTKPVPMSDYKAFRPLLPVARQLGLPFEDFVISVPQYRGEDLSLKVDETRYTATVIPAVSREKYGARHWSSPTSSGGGSTVSRSFGVPLPVQEAKEKLIGLEASYVSLSPSPLETREMGKRLVGELVKQALGQLQHFIKRMYFTDCNPTPDPDPKSGILASVTVPCKLLSIGEDGKMQDIGRRSGGEYKASTRFCVFSYTRDRSGSERPLCCGSTNNTKFEVRADFSIHAFCYQCKTGGVIITSPLDTSRFKPVSPSGPLISPSTMRHARDVTIVDYSDVANCRFDQHCASPYLKELSAGSKLYERNTLKTIAIKSSMGTGKTVAAREAINRFEREFREAKLAEYNVTYTPQLVKNQCQISPVETAVPTHPPARLFKEGDKAWEHNMHPLLFKHASREESLSEGGGYLLECNSAHGVPTEITYFPDTHSFYETVTYETPSFTCRSTGLPAHGPFTSSLKGRTLETIEEMNEAIRARSLVISFRAMLAQANTTQLNTVCYSTLSDEELSNEDRVSVQLDSMPRLATLTSSLTQEGPVVTKKAPRYDLVFVDESESCINHLSSNTMRDRRNLVFSLFKGFIKTANVVIFADADMGERTRFIIDNFRRDSPVEFHHNPYNPRELTYIEYASLHTWIDKMVQLIVKGKKIFLFSNLRDTLHAVSKVVRRRVYEIGENTNKEWLMAIGHGEGVKVLDSNMDNNEKVRMARDCNAEWSQYTLFCVTPVIGAGVSFDAEHFDASFGFGSNTSNSPREFLQMGGRVRNLKMGECHLYLDVPKVERTPIANTQEEYMAKILEDRVKTDHFSEPIVRSSETDIVMEYKLPYVENYTRALNCIEKDMARVDFMGQLHKVLYANNPDVVIRFNHELNDLLEYRAKVEMRDKKEKVKELLPRQIADSSYHGDQMEHINREDRAGRQPLNADGEGVMGIHFSQEKHEAIKALCLKHPVELSLLERRKYEMMLSETISGVKVKHLEAIHSLLIMDAPFPSKDNTMYQARIVNRKGGVVYKSRKNFVRDRLGDLDRALIRTVLDTLVIASGAMQVGARGQMEPVANYWPHHSWSGTLLEFQLHTGVSWFINDVDLENPPLRMSGQALLTENFDRAAFRARLEDIWPTVLELVGPHVDIGALGSAPKKDKSICTQVRFALKKILVGCFGVKLQQDTGPDGKQVRCGLKMPNEYHQLCPHRPRTPCTVFRIQAPEMKRLLPYLLGYTQYRVDDGNENSNTTSAAKAYNSGALQKIIELHTRHTAGLLPLQETSRFTGLASLQVAPPVPPKKHSSDAKRDARKAEALGDSIRAAWEKIKEENVPLPLSDTPALALANFFTSTALKMRMERLVNKAINHFQLAMVRARKELGVEDVSTRRFDAQQRSIEKNKSDIETSIKLNIQQKNTTPPAPSMLHPHFLMSESDPVSDALESAGELTAPPSPIDLHDMDDISPQSDSEDSMRTKRPRSDSDLFALEPKRDDKDPAAKRFRDEDPKSITTTLSLNPSSRPAGAEPYHGMYYTVERSTPDSPWQVSKKRN